MKGTNYYSKMADLNRIDWNILKKRDFKKSSDDIDKSRRYQAEALVHRHLPVQALVGIACHDQPSFEKIAAHIAQRNLSIPVKVLRDWYF